MIGKVLFLLLSVLTFLFFPASYASERILSFDSRITVHKDSTMTVTETIKVNAEGNQIKRGIYRDFPTKYTGGYTVGFTIREVKRDGSPDSYHTENLQNGIRVYTGKSNVFIPHGEHTYELTYETDRQLGFFEDHDELYWNVTGNGWIFPIEKASATVILPEDIPQEKIKTDGYTGPQGSKTKEFTALEQYGNPYFITTQPLRAYEGFTIVVGWPKGYVTQPQAVRTPYLQNTARSILRNLLIPVFLVALLFLYYVIAWSRVGVNPPKGTIIPLFAPPKGISPAATRYMMKMGFDNKTVTAAMIDMAVKGSIKIEETSGLIYKKYIISRTGGDQRALSKEEGIMYSGLFGDSRDHVELKNENYEIVQRVISTCKNALKMTCETLYFITNIKFFIIGVIASSVVFTFYLLSAINSINPAFWLIFSPGLIFLNLLFYHLLKAPTQAGRLLMDQIEGFKMYLGTAEKDEIRGMGAPAETPQLFEKYLPYAIALDMENAWGRRFTEVLSKAGIDGGGYSPVWYSGTSFNSSNMGAFASSMGGSLSTAISSSSTAPGSSSGGGGGGGSGGGGGGGGGGGW